MAELQIAATDAVAMVQQVFNIVGEGGKQVSAEKDEEVLRAKAVLEKRETCVRIFEQIVRRCGGSSDVWLCGRFKNNSFLSKFLKTTHSCLKTTHSSPAIFCICGGLDEWGGG